MLNAGFYDSVGSRATIEGEDLTPPGEVERFLVSYVRAIHLKAGNVQILIVTGPDGGVLASTILPPLDRDQA